MNKEKQVLRVLLKNYTKISYKGGIAKVIFDGCFEDMAEEIVKLFAIPDVSQQRELLIDFCEVYAEGQFEDPDDIEGIVDWYMKVKDN